MSNELERDHSDQYSHPGEVDRPNLTEMMKLMVADSSKLEMLVETTHEIKNQLVLLNGRVRQNQVDVAAIKANVPLTRDYCDEQRADIEARRVKLDERVRKLEGRLPSFIQTIVVALFTGGILGLVSYFLSRVP